MPRPGGPRLADALDRADGQLAVVVMGPETQHDVATGRPPLWATFRDLAVMVPRVMGPLVRSSWLPLVAVIETAPVPALMLKPGVMAMTAALVAVGIDHSAASGVVGDQVRLPLSVMMLALRTMPAPPAGSAPPLPEGLLTLMLLTVMSLLAWQDQGRPLSVRVRKTGATAMVLARPRHSQLGGGKQARPYVPPACSGRGQEGVVERVIHRGLGSCRGLAENALARRSTFWLSTGLMVRH